MTWGLVHRIAVGSPEEVDRIVEAFRRRAGSADRQPGSLGPEGRREAGGTVVLVPTR